MLQVTELLIRHGANVGATDLWQFSPLHEAASKSRTEVCSLLLSHGADPFALNCHAKSSVDVASTQELKDRLVLEHKGHCLLAACRQADLPRVKKALSSSSSSPASLEALVNFRHPYSHDTAVHCTAGSSCFPKRKSVLELLARKGAGISEKNKDFLTPLHMAAEKSHYDIMEALLKAGAKVNALDAAGETSLHRSSRESNVQACRILLSYGADPTIVSLQGYTASQLASDESVVKLLTKEGSSSSSTSLSSSMGSSSASSSGAAAPSVQQPTAVTGVTMASSSTAQCAPTASGVASAATSGCGTDTEYQLLEAAKAGDLELVKKIVSDFQHIVNCRDLDGRHSTPLHFAAGYNRVGVVDFLLSKGGGQYYFFSFVRKIGFFSSLLHQKLVYRCQLKKKYDLFACFRC